jgi:hypothetical protein
LILGATKLSDWENDKKWSDKYLTQIKSIIGQTFIQSAPIEEDQERNTDLIVFKMEPIRIACRLRREEYFKRYQNEFTLRFGRPSGTKTELTKIVEGWGNFFFYGFADDNKIIYWKIGDLNVFRLWFNRSLIKYNGSMPWKQITNSDNSSSFIIFEWDNLPKDFVVAEIIA